MKNEISVSRREALQKGEEVTTFDKRRTKRISREATMGTKEPIKEVEELRDM